MANYKVIAENGEGVYLVENGNHAALVDADGNVLDENVSIPAVLSRIGWEPYYGSPVNKENPAVEDQPRDESGMWTGAGAMPKLPSTQPAFSTDKIGEFEEGTSQLSPATADKAYTWAKDNGLYRKFGAGPEEELVGSYQATYSRLNAGLREGDIPEGFTDQVAAMDKVIAESRLPGAVQVYRGMSMGNPESLVGKTISDKAYMSTTMVRDLGVTYAGIYGGRQAATLMEIDVPAGSQAFFQDQVSWVADAPEQAELLFGRNTKLEVIGHRKEGGMNILRAKVVK